MSKAYKVISRPANSEELWEIQRLATWIAGVMEALVHQQESEGIPNEDAMRLVYKMTVDLLGLTEKARRSMDVVVPADAEVDLTDLPF